MYQQLVRKSQGKSPQKHNKQDRRVGIIHLDIMVLQAGQNGSIRPYLFVAIEEYSRWAYMAVFNNKSHNSVKTFLDRLMLEAPFKTHTVIMDRSSLPLVASDAYRIKQRPLTQDKRLMTRRTERFFCRIERFLQPIPINSNEALEKVIDQYRDLYLKTPQLELGGKAPADMLKHSKTMNGLIEN